MTHVFGLRWDVLLAALLEEERRSTSKLTEESTKQIQYLQSE